LEKGKIYLVGAGPGDPDLLTLKALNVIKNCDVIIYDALMNPEILKHAPDQVEKIFIGKSRHTERMTQREVEELMINKAKEGLDVVRLKGGDPFVFGRGGEEAEITIEAGLDWEVVPGISSGVAVPAYAGIPLTHRDCASYVTFITGHESNEDAKVEWEKIRSAYHTLVIFMGITKLPDTVSKLLSGDYKPETPIAIIESGTTSKQNVRVSTLGEITTDIEKTPVKTPALVVIGEVVNYREKLGK